MVNLSRVRYSQTPLIDGFPGIATDHPATEFPLADGDVVIWSGTMILPLNT
jgi:hypothetical protein